jgi:hypothetical protein
MTRASGKYKGTSILQDEQDQGRKLIQALSEGQRERAILKFSKSGNNNLTEAFKDNVVLDYAGIRASELSERHSSSYWSLPAFIIDNMTEGHARV